MTDALGLVFTSTVLLAVAAGGCTTGKTTGKPTGDDARVEAIAADAERYASQAEADQVAWADGRTGRTSDAAQPPPPIPEPVRRVSYADPPAAAATAAVQPTPPAPQPEPKLVTVSREMSEAEMLTALADRLKRDAAADPTLKPWVGRAALAALDPRYELSANDLAALSPENRRVVQAYQRLFLQVGQSLGQSMNDDRRALEDLAAELSDAIDQRQPLTIRNLKLCRKVNGFGVYEAFARNAFLAGQAHPMIVYVELDNFRSNVGTDGKHRVRLTQEVVLYNEADGLPVWRQRPVEITDESHNRRRDFFVVQVIRLSERLTVGKYLLKVTLTDEIGQSVDEATVPVQIVADEQLTKP